MNNTILNEIFAGSNLATIDNASYKQQGSVNTEQEIAFLKDTIQESGLSTEQELEVWDKLKRTARNITAAVMIGRDVFKQRKLDGYKHQDTVITQDINKDRPTEKPQSEITPLQEIFQEANVESFIQAPKNNDDNGPETRRDGTAAKTVERHKRVGNMNFTPSTVPKRPAVFRPQTKSGKINEEFSLLGEIFQESSF